MLVFKKAKIENTMLCEYIVSFASSDEEEMRPKEIAIVVDWTGMPRNNVKSALRNPEDCIVPYIKTYFMQYM